jgi:hypothetical protein
LLLGVNDQQEAIVARATGGGRATQTGTGYQNRCAAWFAVLILAEEDAALPLELPAHETLASIRSESDQPVDDINLSTISGGVVLGQAKHTLNLETAGDSDLGLTINQFVRQFHDARDRLPGALPRGRDLEPGRDRLVILTGPTSSAGITKALPELLRRLRLLAPYRNGEPIDTAASNADERRALAVLRAHVERNWAMRVGSAPSEADVGAVLELVHVLVLDVDPNGSAEREALTLLRRSILKDASQADTVWKTLVENQALLARMKGGIGREGLQGSLIRDGIDLRGTRSYRADIAQLLAITRDTLDHQVRFSGMHIGGRQIKVKRACVGALLSGADAGSVLVVGEPGAGKSGAQFDAVQELRLRGRDVVMLAAESLAAGSLGELRDELGLEHEVLEVLDNWPGVLPGYLVIDALDAARSEAVARTLRLLIDRVVSRNGRWRVVASVRKFDLRYSQDLKRLLPGSPVPGFADPEFAHVRHLNVPLFDDSELGQVKRQSDELRAVLDAANTDLTSLLRVPFNLSLVAALLEGGATVAELTPIRTQLELLDRYWTARVVREDRRGDARDVVLRMAAQEMVGRRALRAPRNVIVRDPSGAGPLHEVLSAGVLVEWPQPGSPRPNQSLLAFSHHLLFDYAVSRLLLRGEPGDLIRRLEEEPDLALAVRPSLVLHYHYLWAEDPSRRAFWQLVALIQASDRVSEIAKTIGPAVAAELFTDPVDIGPLVQPLGETDER